MNSIEDILDKDKIKGVDGKVYNCLNESESSQFYSELFSESFEKRNRPELFEQVKASHSQAGTAYRIMDKIVGKLRKMLPAEASVIEIGGGVHQQRAGNAYQYFPNYYPLDISDSSINRYVSTFDRPGVVADATELPFKSDSIDCIFTHTFLEHPIQPEEVVSEIARVIKPGGIVVHNDAWFCRWWQRHGVVGLKRFGNMSTSEKMIAIGAKITEFPPLRIPPIVIGRFFRETFGGKARTLRYSKLNPNYELHLGCDEDAASRIDPIDVVRFYEANGFSLVSPLSTKQRLFYPNKYVMLKKDL